MSRRKQTKPFKVEDQHDLRKERKPKLRKILPRADILAQDSSSQSDFSRGNLSDGDEMYGSEVRHSKRGTKCNQCGKVLASSLSLARHKLTHSENKPFQCPQCGAGFKTSSNMHRHLRIHFRETKEQSDAEITASKQLRLSSQRSPRQNIRTPNKFKEFDVDLVGMGLRGSADGQVTNARSYSKPKGSLIARQQSLKEKNEHDIDESVVQAVTEHSDNGEQLPDLNSSRKHCTSLSSKLESTSKVDDLVCHVCSKSFISRFGLLTHSMSHSKPESSTKCHLCSQSFSTPRGLVVHNMIVHRIAGNQEKSKKKERGLQHIALLDFSATKFTIVAEAACTKSQWSRPLRDAQHIFICKKCDKAFPLLEALELHMKKTHWSNETSAPQQDASASFLAQIDLRMREKDGEDVPKEENVSSVRNGVDDDSIFTSKSIVVKDIPLWLQHQPDIISSNYQKETDVAPNHRQFKLFAIINQFQDGEDKKDSKYFNSSSSVMNTGPISHNRRKTRNQVDSGSILRRFDNASRNEGDKSVGERNVFWCRICNYSSHEKSALVRHLLTHSGIRPYFCKICDYAFTTKANCERHVRKRHNCIDRVELDAAVRCDWEMLKKAPRDDIYMISGSNSSCPVCNKSFPCNNDLKQHLKIHEERQFVCQLCNVRCTTRNNCVRHILHKHPGIPHQEANNIITFAGTSGKNLGIDNLPDIIKDKSEIDISKGRLGRKKSTDKNQTWTKFQLKQSRTCRSEQLHAKKPRKSFPSLKNFQAPNSTDKVENSVPVSLTESGTWHEVSEEKSNRPIRALPLIPLLKIKAYNEAATRSYADMRALYHHLSFLNSDTDAVTLDDTIMPVVESTHEAGGEDTFARGETMFICRSCSKSFETEDELNSHIVLCEENDQFFINFKSIFNCEESRNDNSNWTSDNDILTESMSEKMKEETSGEAKDEVWNIGSAAKSPCNLLQVEVLEGIQNVKEWGINSSADSPYSVKSVEGSDAREYSQVSQSHNKDLSYVEDSLLMSMFADERRKKEYDGENKGRSQTSLTISRYASSFPTMVNMDSPTMTRIKYQSSGNLSSLAEGTDKMVLSAKGKVYSARKCPQCDKTFPWASSLRRHIMTHTGLKLYMCRLCKMRFTTRSNLIRHVYRRHGMAKQHPDFASCLAKLHPSDTLLREVEADVRRRIDVQKNRSPTIPVESDNVSNGDDEEYLEESLNMRKKGVTSDFQSMLEEDPETMLVDLDYSPRDEASSTEDKKIAVLLQKKTTAQNEDMPNERLSASPKEFEDDEVHGNKIDPGAILAKTSSNEDSTKEVKKELTQEATPHRVRSLRRRSGNKSFTDQGSVTPTKSVSKPKVREVEENPNIESGSKTKSRSSKQSSQFVCGLCKKIFKTVPDLISHLDTHNIPHSWHCPVCGVPFTNKYNCQRHLTRRHGRADVEPLYVEDSKHGPRTARGQPRKTTDGNDAP